MNLKQSMIFFAAITPGKSTKSRIGMKHSASISIKILAVPLHQIIGTSLISLEINGQKVISLEAASTGFSPIFTRSDSFLFVRSNCAVNYIFAFDVNSYKRNDLMSNFHSAYYSS